MLNIKNQPAKSALKKEKKSLVNDNAIRVGEMETTNLQACKRPDLVSKLLRSYSTSKDDRENLIETLITADDPLNITVPDSDSKSITRQMLDKYLAVLGLELED